MGGTPTSHSRESALVSKKILAKAIPYFVIPAKAGIYSAFQ